MVRWRVSETRRRAAGSLLRHTCLLLVSLLLAKIDAVLACPISLPSVEKLYAQASAVFVGRLARVEEAGVVSAGELLPRRVAVEGTVRIVEVLKGQPPPDGKIRAPAFEACGPVLLVGWEYLFFLNEGKFLASWDGALPVVSWTSERERFLEKLGTGRK